MSPVEMMTDAQFQKTIWHYYRANRRRMPWRMTRDPYRILVSEIMLQQTQVLRVLKFYEKFIKRFPDFHALARAETADVLRAWQGLGYNRRALALQKLAREVVKKYNGRLPRDKGNLISLPGIGEYTAGAIRAFAFNEPEIFIETNIRRVFIYFFFPRQKKVTDEQLRRYIGRTVVRYNPREWYFALMDYGAMLGGAARKPVRSGRNATGVENPNRRSAHYARQSVFAGSDREIRGKILREFLAGKKILSSAVLKELDEPRGRILRILETLGREGFLVKTGKYIQLA